MILDLLLWVLRLSEIHSAPLHEDIRLRAQSAYDFISHFADPISGLAPNYGSDDGSLIFPLAPASYHDFRPLLQLGAAVLNRAPLTAGPWDESSLWFGVKPTAVEETTYAPSPDTGYFRLGDESSWAMIRAGKYSRRPFQADQLHVDLWGHGINLARDAGTHLYNGPPPWNNGLAGTAVHNTVMVDHEDQMRRAGRFLWVEWAQASGKTYASGGRGCADRFAGEHDGYRRFGVIHHRTVQWLAGSGWIIVDDILNDLEATGDHDMRLHWLTPDLPFEISSSSFHVAFTSEQARIRWSIFSSAPGSAAVVRAGKLEQIVENVPPQCPLPDVHLLGWEAPTYGDLRPAVSLVHHTRSRLPLRLVTVVLTDERCRLEIQRSDVAILSGEPMNDFEYRVDLSPRTSRSSPQELEQRPFPVRKLKV